MNNIMHSAIYTLESCFTLLQVLLILGLQSPVNAPSVHISSYIYTRRCCSRPWVMCLCHRHSCSGPLPHSNSIKCQTFVLLFSLVFFPKKEMHKWSSREYCHRWTFVLQYFTRMSQFNKVSCIIHVWLAFVTNQTTSVDMHALGGDALVPWPIWRLCCYKAPVTSSSSVFLHGDIYDLQ